MTARRRRLTSGLAAAVFAALPWVPANAAAVGPAGLAELVARAERIVVSEVVDVRSELRQTRDGQLPFSLVTLRVVRTLKGTPSVQLLIEVPGGEIAKSGNTRPGERLKIVGMPSFTVGDRDVLFLASRGALSPLVGLGRGRYRAVPGPAGTGETVRTHDGRPLQDANGDALALGAFVRQVLELVEQGSLPVASGQRPVASASRGPEPNAWASADDASVSSRAAVQGLWPAPLAVTVRLGSSPALLNGCPDWPCVVARALEPFGAPSDRRDTVAREAAGTGAGRGFRRAARTDEVSLGVGWATEIFGRSLDDLTPAVTVRRVADGRRSVSVLLNQELAWNAYPGESRIDGTGRPLFDLERVLGAELREVLEPAPGAADTATTPASATVERPVNAPTRQSGTSRSPASQDTGVQARALAPCDPNSGIMTNPRMLIFQSPDDWAMSGYQVGIFREGFSSPERTVDLGREAFLLRRVVDLPGAATTMQQSFVTMIQASGLGTANGIVYTYRVRGVWGGGTTAWSEPSDPFATCPR